MWPVEMLVKWHDFLAAPADSFTFFYVAFPSNHGRRLA
jgi:hypothetical protein